jgi:phosphoglucosamine mutase
VADKLFGTDGVRGVAGEVLTAELAIAIGRSAATAAQSARPQAVIVRDTRESGPMLEAALAAGFAQGGGDAWVAGVLPTPAASVLVRAHGFDLAGVISASHNPWRDNGIKLFGPEGAKLDDETEERLESELDAEIERGVEGAGAEIEVGRVRSLEGGLDDYLRELERVFALELGGRRIALDCAHGATFRAAPAAFARLGADVEVIGDEPDGRNINDRVGSTHPEALAERVRSGEADIGFAFDGDGDRVIAVDDGGEVRDGDELLALAAGDLAERGELDGGIAVTVMSNYGFHQAMADAGIEVETTPVGDRHVSAALSERGWSLGGEQSGHLIWRQFAPTGDGIAAALLTLRSLGSRPLSEAIPMRKLPQLLRNVEVADRGAFERSDEMRAAIERESEALEGRGRVLVRPSGTEPLIRVMVEAPDAAECEVVCERLVAQARRELG